MIAEQHVQTIQDTKMGSGKYVNMLTLNRRPVSLSGSNICLSNAHFYNTTQQRNSADRIAAKHANFIQNHSSCKWHGMHMESSSFISFKGEHSGIYCFCVGTRHAIRVSALHSESPMRPTLLSLLTMIS